MTLAFTSREQAGMTGVLHAPRPAAAAGAANGPAPDPQHDARHLTGPGGTARILLDGQPYVLRITRAGKLILTK